ncbi:hypothetical protein K458DRAFT_23074 [Lentithecium fluviatile CBS 122367]|uniref:Uncharacterized protein n=1 Tax=Lentithecium fluviatile CBS 122367 TaxID=1168545 RepID=A0A6G1J491_9PLEO|nr:hypothetical protein K458DRAFT_23074 [Lentithecium fluviatile CBS 122367]
MILVCMARASTGAAPSMQSSVIAVQRGLGPATCRMSDFQPSMPFRLRVQRRHDAGNLLSNTSLANRLAMPWGKSLTDGGSGRSPQIPSQDCHVSDPPHHPLWLLVTSIPATFSLHISIQTSFASNVRVDCPPCGVSMLQSARDTIAQAWCRTLRPIRPDLKLLVRISNSTAEYLIRGVTPYSHLSGSPILPWSTVVKIGGDEYHATISRSLGTVEKWSLPRSSIGP